MAQAPQLTPPPRRTRRPGRGNGKDQTRLRVLPFHAGINIADATGYPLSLLCPTASQHTFGDLDPVPLACPFSRGLTGDNGQARTTTDRSSLYVYDIAAQLTMRDGPHICKAVLRPRLSLSHAI